MALDGVLGGMKPQARGVDGVRTRIAMQMGAAMAEAQVELARPGIGEEAAELCGRAARAAVMAFNDSLNPESPGFSVPVVGMVLQQAYATEWARLSNVARAEWRV